MTTTMTRTEARPSGAVKMLRLRGSCLKVVPVCRQRRALVKPRTGDWPDHARRGAATALPRRRAHRARPPRRRPTWSGRAEVEQAGRDHRGADEGGDAGDERRRHLAASQRRSDPVQLVLAPRGRPVCSSTCIWVAYQRRQRPKRARPGAWQLPGTGTCPERRCTTARGRDRGRTSSALPEWVCRLGAPTPGTVT
jgi:hypothetical protein